MLGSATCVRLQTLRLPATLGLGGSAHGEPQLRRQRFVVGIREGVVGDGAFGGGHGVAADVGFGRTLGKRKEEEGGEETSAG